ncbi:energy transducer TonB [Pelagicoccus sp. SDUM812003]|uniref:energy transducer TonB n=1 Tax=Pelagicoccus sp. SDUM812003 TaxID=3041267 RepID=UPI00280F67F7|nr:energy transducer TonB [Pelagicoccus sp. SDUM812003]MDQ8203097.1 energy transducer TonB [Pelagicoccus sp. SDUM812003]
MKTVIRITIAAACLLLSNPIANAETFALASGERIEGVVTTVRRGQVTFQTDSDQSATHALSALDDASKEQVERWMENNPDKVDVYEAWDVKPVVLRSKAAVTPPNLCTPGFKGIVSMEVTLDEQGRVIHSNVSKSTHSDLDEAAQDAIKDWQFKPAKIAGEHVKAKIAISFQFKA